MFILASAACASGSSSSASAPTPSASGSVNPGVAPARGWNGSFQPVQQQTGNLTPRGTNRTYGSVTLTASSASENRTHAEIEISTTLPTSALLHWALSSGRCGSSTLPLLGVDQFPSIEVSNSGQGKLSSDIPVTLPTSGSYHVDIFWSGGQDRSDVMACANLRAAAH